MPVLPCVIVFYRRTIKKIGDIVNRNEEYVQKLCDRKLVWQLNILMRETTSLRDKDSLIDKNGS